MYNIVKTILARVHRAAMTAHHARAAARMLPPPPRTAGRPPSRGATGTASDLGTPAADVTAPAKRRRDSFAAAAGKLADTPTASDSPAALLAQARDLADGQAKKIKFLLEQLAQSGSHKGSTGTGTGSQSLHTVSTTLAGGAMGGAGGGAAAAAKTATADFSVGEDTVLQPATFVRLRAQRKQLDVLKASMDFDAAAAVKESA